jgi:quercetin dioxygenase-like cupin family protein
MNLKSNHSNDKPVSAVPLFKGEGVATALQILQNQELKEHMTKVKALLICIVGEVVFENEKGIKETLQSGEFVNIEPLVKHWIIGNKDSQLLLLK